MKKTIFVMIVALFSPQVLQSQLIDYYQKPLQFERSRDFDALHYLIKIDLDITNKAFQGETTLTLSSLQDGLERCTLDAEDFSISSVLSNWGEPLKFEQSDNKLTVHLSSPLAYGEIISFTVFYKGQNPKQGLEFFENTDEHPALVYSNSWPDGVHHWFPCYDFPNDKVTNEIIATVKKGNKVAANGRLISITENKAEDTVTYHWSQELPHSTYLIFLAAAPYVIIRDAYGTLPINYWVYPQHAQDALRSYKNTPKMMEFFNRIFGYDYPWAKYDQVSCPLGGGAESTSATAMTHRIIHDERAEQDFSSIGIVSHELAHQWWGDLITLRTWAHAWMNEGFGTYSDYLYYRYERGEDEGAINLEGKKNGYLREAKTRYLRPVVIDHYDKPGDLFDTHSYRKGASVLHMLRFLVGDEAFFRTLKYFLHTHAFEAVDTHDFMKAVKTVTGQNLDWFFEQWIFKAGHPIFDISYTWDEKVKILELTVNQKQDISQGIPVFKTPVIIGIWTDKGKESHKIWIKHSEEVYEFKAEHKPLMVRFDVGNFLLKEWTFLKDQAELIYQMQQDDVMGRKWAAGQLLRYKDNQEVVSSLEECARKDAFWAVRLAAVETLEKITDHRPIEFFKHKCTDENSKVRAAALAALGNLGSPELAEFFKERFAQDDSYVAQAAALEAIGKTGDKNQTVFLKKAAQMPSYRNLIKNAAQKALELLEKNSR